MNRYFNLSIKFDLSIVIPIHNEEDCIGSLYAALKDGCDGLNMNYEFVFVDDGSTDATFKKLSELHRDGPRIRVVKFRKNYCQTAAMAVGFEHARGKIKVPGRTKLKH